MCFACQNKTALVSNVSNWTCRRYIRPANFEIVKSGTTVWKDTNTLRYLAYVCTITELSNTSGLDADAKFDTVFSYGPFAGSVCILHGSGNPVHFHHVLAFNAYLDGLIVTKEMPSKTGFMKYWSDYKREIGGSVSSVPSPYKWEVASVKDKLGVYSPPLVMDIIGRRRDGIWGALVAQIGTMYMGV